VAPVASDGTIRTDAQEKFNDAGIEVYIAKFAPSSWSDEEIDYAYTAREDTRLDWHPLTN